MIGRHPSKRRLAAWWNDDAPDGSIAEHVETCEICAGRIEALVPGEPAPAHIGRLLGDLLSPEDHLSDRMRSGIADRMRTEADLKMVADLLGIGFRTARLLAVDVPAEQNRHEEDR